MATVKFMCALCKIFRPVEGPFCKTCNSPVCTSCVKEGAEECGRCIINKENKSPNVDKRCEAISQPRKCPKCLNLQPVYRICCECDEARKYYCVDDTCWDILHAEKHRRAGDPMWFCPTCAENPVSEKYRSVSTSHSEAKKGIQAEIEGDLNFFRAQTEFVTQLSFSSVFAEDELKSPSKEACLKQKHELDEEFTRALENAKDELKSLCEEAYSGKKHELYDEIENAEEFTRALENAKDELKSLCQEACSSKKLELHDESENFGEFVCTKVDLDEDNPRSEDARKKNGEGAITKDKNKPTRMDDLFGLHAEGRPRNLQCTDCLNMQPVYRLCSRCKKAKKYYCADGYCWKIFSAKLYDIFDDPIWICVPCAPGPRDFTKNYLAVDVSLWEAHKGILAELDNNVEFFSRELSHGVPTKPAEEELAKLMEACCSGIDSRKNKDQAGSSKSKGKIAVMAPIPVVPAYRLAYLARDSKHKSEAEVDDLELSFLGESDLPQRCSDSDEEKKSDSEDSEEEPRPPLIFHAERRNSVDDIVKGRRG